MPFGMHGTYLEADPIMDEVFTYLLNNIIY